MKKILFFTLASFMLFSCSSNDQGSGEVIPVNEFSVKTHAVSNIGYQSATVFGVISPSFISNTTAYGICYGTTPNPTLDGDFTTAANINPATGTFSSNLSPLFQNSTYYARAYGTSSDGTKYGEQVIFNTT